MVNCDDYGLMDGRPIVLKSKLFPLHEEITKNTVDALIDKLATVGLVARYKNAKGDPYLQLPTWCKYQQVRNRKSKYPLPPGYEIIDGKLQATDSTCNQLISIDINSNQLQSIDVPIQSNPIQVIKDKEKNKKRNMSEPDEVFSKAIVLWEKYIGTASPNLADKIALLVEDYGFIAFKTAIDRAVEYNKRSFPWIKSVAENVANGDDFGANSKKQWQQPNGKNRSESGNDYDTELQAVAAKAGGEII